MVSILKHDHQLILKYYSEYRSGDWVDEKMQNDENFSVLSIFQLNRELLVERISDDFEEPEFHFLIGELIDDYYKIDNEVLGLTNNFFFHKDIDICVEHFHVQSKTSLLLQIDRFVDTAIYIGGDKEDILPFEAFENLIEIFPTSHEITLYRHAKVTSILTNYFNNITDKEESYKKYINKKTPLIRSELRKTFQELDILKYETLLEKLQQMLSNEISYSEKQWQEEILQIILLIFPKYIAVFEEVQFKDIYNNKTRRLDYGLIDFMGNLDLIEIKVPFDKSIVSVNPYRDNHIPNRDLSGTIMQIEKYIYYLNKTGIAGERKLTEKYKEQLPDNLEIKITNPNGMIIMGRDINLTMEQLADFEIIKRKYKNVIDIFTYDDLLRRMEIMIKQLRKL
ncbi:DUF4263 domain-containing protein [Chryseobacterium gotjawalense]|uniref:DUF4263 domain-containing protein n=1 Tax=Chryseobacterium gotjawalense TaxID=3042315 RepID=A0ABY8RAK4_9FLAO|nr:Shedu immune nuclease family protein [Chryseobacterium sp. wdc7]WHF50990.1 DUF4263 domain-containing protein [Chryseobacterium sp. wdc7]